MRGQYVQITKIRYLCFDFVHSRYTRMAGFGRREIELMQALCIYNIYIEYYSVTMVLMLDGSSVQGIVYIEAAIKFEIIVFQERSVFLYRLSGFEGPFYISTLVCTFYIRFFFRKKTCTLKLSNNQIPKVNLLPCQLKNGSTQLELYILKLQAICN